MGISEKKMKIVINNYFKQECDVNTSIREAFEKGFRIGVKKASSVQPEPKWISVNDKLPEEGSPVLLLYINEEIGFSESCRPKFWNQLTDNTIVGWFPIPKETKING